MDLRFGRSALSSSSFATSNVRALPLWLEEDRLLGVKSHDYSSNYLGSSEEVHLALEQSQE